MSRFGVEALPIARREHRCEWCGQTIRTGERHYRWSGRGEDGWERFRMHAECREAWVDTDESTFFPWENNRPERDPTPREVYQEREQAGQLALLGARRR